MTDSAFDVDAAEADVAEQLIPVEVGDDFYGLEDGPAAAPTVISRDLDATEADLIDQAIAVPLTDDDPDFDR